jgi:hypothetical protein
MNYRTAERLEVVRGLFQDRIDILTKAQRKSFRKGVRTGFRQGLEAGTEMYRAAVATTKTLVRLARCGGELTTRRDAREFIVSYGSDEFHAPKLTVIVTKADPVPVSDFGLSVEPESHKASGHVRVPFVGGVWATLCGVELDLPAFFDRSPYGPRDRSLDLAVYWPDRSEDAHTRDALANFHWSLWHTGMEFRGRHPKAWRQGAINGADVIFGKLHTGRSHIAQQTIFVPLYSEARGQFMQKIVVTESVIRHMRSRRAHRFFTSFDFKFEPPLDMGDGRSDCYAGSWGGETLEEAVRRFRAAHEEHNQPWKDGGGRQLLCGDEGCVDADAPHTHESAPANPDDNGHGCAEGCDLDHRAREFTNDGEDLGVPYNFSAASKLVMALLWHYTPEATNVGYTIHRTKEAAEHFKTIFPGGDAHLSECTMTHVDRDRLAALLGDKTYAFINKDDLTWLQGD